MISIEIDRNISKEQAAEKKQRQVINNLKLIRGAEKKKEEAKKTLEQLNNNEPTTKREKKQIDYAALADKNLELRNNRSFVRFNTHPKQRV